MGEALLVRNSILLESWLGPLNLNRLHAALGLLSFLVGVGGIAIKTLQKLERKREDPNATVRHFRSNHGFYGAFNGALWPNTKYNVNLFLHHPRFRHSRLWSLAGQRSQRSSAVFHQRRRWLDLETTPSILRIGWISCPDGVADVRLQYRVRSETVEAASPEAVQVLYIYCHHNDGELRTSYVCPGYYCIGRAISL